MKYSVVFLLALWTMAACEDEEPEPCTVEPEPFRFIIVDQTGANQLSDDLRPDNTRIFFLENGDDISLELYYEGSGEATYGVSPVLPLISVAGPDFYLLERGSTLDTLSVRVTREPPGSNCGEYVYSTVTFNGVAAEYDTTTDPPVYVLVE